MKLQKPLFFISTVITIAYSCNKKSDTDVLPTSTGSSQNNYTDYSNFKTGNYWVYQEYQIDSLGNETETNKFDSCYVEKDTAINGKTYFKLVKPKPYFENQFEISYQRDSLHYIVNSKGEILFSSQDFASTLSSTYFFVTDSTANDTLCLCTLKMTGNGASTTVPAGTYTTIDAKTTYQMYPNWSAAGNPRYRHTRYAQSLGIITETLPFFVNTPQYTERRLVRYHTN